MAIGSADYTLLTSAAPYTNPTITEYTASSLTSGQAYKFKVASYNALFNSLQTDYIYVIASDLPEKPVNPPVINTISQSAITLTLTTIPTANNGGSSVTGYIVMMDDGLGGIFTQIQDSLNTQLTISNLYSGRSYRIKYAGRNIVYDQNNLFDCDSLKYSDSVEVLTAVNPLSPQNLQKDPVLRYKDQIVIEWQAPSDNGGSPLITYTLGLLDVQASSETYTTISSSAYTYTFTSLTPGYQYQIRIKSTNLVGDSEFTSYIVTYAGTEPTSPGIITFTGSTRNSLDLQWSALTSDDTGGTALNPISITSYNLYMDNGYNGDFELLTSVSGTSHTVQYLIPGLMYRFKLQALNAIGY